MAFLVPAFAAGGLVALSLSACGSSHPAVEGPPMGMVSAGEITPPENACELVTPLPALGPEVEQWGPALAAAGLKLPDVDEGHDPGCPLDAFECRAMYVSIFPTDDPQLHHVGFSDADGKNHLVTDAFGSPEDGTCGVSAPKVNTYFDGPIAVAERTFTDCQSAMDYRDWLVFDTANADLVVRLHCQGDGSISVEGDGKTIVIECVGRTFKLAPGELTACYAG